MIRKKIIWDVEEEVPNRRLEGLIRDLYQSKDQNNHPEYFWARKKSNKEGEIVYEVKYKW